MGTTPPEKPPQISPDAATSAPFPNRLREIREASLLSRAALIQLCRALAAQDAIRYSVISMTTLHDLEAGVRRPRLSTAATLSIALNTHVDQLFTSGLDLIARNPAGNTSDPEKWSRRGRPRKDNTPKNNS